MRHQDNTNLMWLHLDDNKLMTLPEHSFDSKPRELEFLNLSNNNMLTTIPENVFRLLAFTSVQLKDNQKDGRTHNYIRKTCLLIIQVLDCVMRVFCSLMLIFIIILHYRRLLFFERL